MEWHDDAGCKRPDIVNFGEGRSCLACGSVEPRPILPPIRQQSEIRILRLQRGAFDDPVVCEVSIQDLARQPEYEAVSYTWADESGDATRSRTIQVGGKPIPVTASCENALRRLRRRFSSRDLWIDAICIDQDNMDERGHQVQLMPRIYSGARKVQVYIGELTPPSQIFLQSLLDESNGCVVHHHDSGIYKFQPELIEFVSRRYFRRAWILQEVALARQATVICGSMTIPWPQITKLVLSKDYGFTADIPPCFSFSHSLYVTPGQEMKLLDLARHCIATDPRDKVFALLGLTPGGKLGPIEADYNLSVSQVYTRTALYLASQHGWMAVLDRAGVSKDVPQNGIPSWVPDWTRLWRGYPKLPSRLPHVPFGEGIWDEETKVLTLDFLQIPVKTPSRKSMFILREPGLVATMRDRMFFRHEDGTYAKAVGFLERFNFDHPSVGSQIIFEMAPRHIARDKFDEPKLPTAPVSSVELRFQREEASGASVLDGCYNHSGPVNWPYMPVSIAVQVFTLTAMEMYQLGVPHLIDHERHGIGAYITRSNLPYTIERRLRDSYGGPPFYHNEIEDLWMQEFQAGNLVKVEALGPAGHDPDFVNLNDSLWRLLVRMYMLQGTSVKLV
ncbi:NADH-cytochrome b5 reductase 1 [Apiospora arundinis]